VPPPAPPCLPRRPFWGCHSHCVQVLGLGLRAQGLGRRHRMLQCLRITAPPPAHLLRHRRRRFTCLPAPPATPPACPDTPAAPHASHCVLCEAWGCLATASPAQDLLQVPTCSGMGTSWACRIPAAWACLPLGTTGLCFYHSAGCLHRSPYSKFSPCVSACRILGFLCRITALLLHRSAVLKTRALLGSPTCRAAGISCHWTLPVGRLPPRYCGFNVRCLPPPVRVTALRLYMDYPAAPLLVYTCACSLPGGCHTLGGMRHLVTATTNRCSRSTACLPQEPLPACHLQGAAVCLTWVHDAPPGDL